MGFIEALFQKFFPQKLPWLVAGIIVKYIIDAMNKKPALEDAPTVRSSNPTDAKAALQPAAEETGKEFKDALRAGKPKFGIFVNSHSPTVAEQFAHAGYDWLLVDCQHGPMDAVTMSAMLCAIQNGGAKSMVRVAGYDDRNGIQQALDLGANGILIPYINNAEEAAAGVSCCLYPFGKAGTRSVYFPQRSMNKQGLLGYAGGNNENVLIALQVETADCIENMEEICAVPRVDLLFLGQNDLCVSMGLFDGKYDFPDMYTSPELQAATDKLIKCANEKDILLGMFQFGTDRVTEFLDKGFNFISVGNDLHHMLTQNFAHKEALVVAANKASGNKSWNPRHTNMPFGGGGALAGHNPTLDAPGTPSPQVSLARKLLSQVKSECALC
jgi:4-hydroxy-2-oxoheptanedioate aldolase